MRGEDLPTVDRSMTKIHGETDRTAVLERIPNLSRAKWKKAERSGARCEISARARTRTQIHAGTPRLDRRARMHAENQARTYAMDARGRARTFFTSTTTAGDEVLARHTTLAAAAAASASSSASAQVQQGVGLRRCAAETYIRPSVRPL